MLTPITRLTVTCDGCDAVAEDDTGAPCHFTTETEAREWLAPDPHATDADATTDADGEDVYDRWHFGGDGTHLCPDCLCAAYGHVRYPHVEGPGAVGRLGAFCLRCARRLDPDVTADRAAGVGLGADAVGRVA